MRSFGTFGREASRRDNFQQFQDRGLNGIDLSSGIQNGLWIRHYPSLVHRMTFGQISSVGRDFVSNDAVFDIFFIGKS